MDGTDDIEHPNPVPGDWPTPAAAPESILFGPLTEERNMAQAIEQTATAKEKADAEHYIFSLGHSREDAEKHAARIGHKKVLAHQGAGENPLFEEDKD
jgi:hypothetical protein